MTETLERIGFIGLGLMGAPMCQRLLSHGFTLNVWNRTASKADALLAAGAQLQPSPAELVRTSQVIGLCVTDTDSVEALLNQPEGLLAGLEKGQVIVDFSSISPKATRRFAEQVALKGAEWVDAPVSGGVPGAEQGQLAIMCGGNQATIERLEPFFAPLARQVTRVGETGSGQVAKIGNQMLVSCNALVIAEMLALAEAAGIEAEQLPKAFAGGFADSLPLQILAPRMAVSEFSNPKWTVKTLLKDLQLAADLAKEENQSTPMSSLAAQLMRMQAARGRLEEDPATLVDLYRQEKP
ncbi:3-hydroxyisobutyrate dehydrogenase [Marinospirillum celere]|uniref:3-hydroxyisobutyrate dehydrogenase n=1 Tax=Marinospirillum celere TaxID=1122252 RepID=A0A1I1ESF2_9GAMM|nr:NAD(P)-dependent oxidoreductase [Marinospirillum celere]SFB89586.1 3-hydroxyisobutyrate dehydrogenase [Marinospirillum celere]